MRESATAGWVALATTVLVLAAILIVGGCGGSDSDSSAGTTTSATATATAPTVPTTPTTTAEAPLRPGSAAAGRRAFMALPCSGCHAAAGRRAAFGPKLAGQGLSRAVIRATIQNGRGQMPAGQASGQDLEDLVAYLASLQ